MLTYGAVLHTSIRKPQSVVSVADVECTCCTTAAAIAYCMRTLQTAQLLQALMVDPVIAADGYTYEKIALEKWLKHNSTSAVTGDILLHTRFVPNVLIKSAISANQGR